MKSSLENTGNPEVMIAGDASVFYPKCTNKEVAI
jgi:hypothetical protein